MAPVTQPAVSRMRWFVAILTGLVVALVIPPPGTLFGSTELAKVVSIVPAIAVAGLIVGARSVRRWLIVALVTGGLALALIALSGIVVAF